MTHQILTVALNPAIDKTYIAPGFAVGGIARASEVRAVAGGKANNVARVVRALGRPVIATGLAAGAAGRWIQEQLEAHGASARYLEMAGETRTCMVMIDPRTGSQTELREPGPEVTPEVAEAFLAHFRRLLPQAAVVVMSGSLPPGLPAEYYAQLVAAAAEAGVPAILDTSGAALRSGLSARPALVKPNRDELQDLLGEVPADIPGLVAACRTLRERGPETVIASLGAEGALLVSDETALLARPPRIAAVNTVGSGDSMVAGLAVALAEGQPPEDAVRLAIACGAANALTPGVAEVEPETVQRLQAQVTVEPVEA